MISWNGNGENWAWAGLKEDVGVWEWWSVRRIRFKVRNSGFIAVYLWIHVGRIMIT